MTEPAKFCRPDLREKFDAVGAEILAGVLSKGSSEAGGSMRKGGGIISRCYR